MRDNLDLQELRDRIDQYQAQRRAIRNRSLITLLGTFIILIWIWTQSDVLRTALTDETYNIVWNLSIAVFPIIVGCILLFTWLIPNARVNRERSKRDKHHVDKIFHDMVEDTTEPQLLPNRTRTYYIVVVFICGLFGSIFIDSSGIITWLMLFGIYIVIHVNPYLKYLSQDNLEESHKIFILHESGKRAVVAIFWMILNTLLIVITGVFASRLQFTFRMYALLYLSIFVLLVGFELYFIYWLHLRYKHFIPLRNGHYDALYQEVGIISTFSNDAGLIVWRGLIELYMGRMVAAEMTWREALTISCNANDIKTMGTALNNIGHALASQNQVEESLEYFATSILLSPEYPSRYYGLLSYYHKLESDSDRALEVGQFMMSLSRKRRFNLIFDFSQWEKNLASLAIAYANTGDLDKARKLMLQAFDECDTEFKSTVAGLHISAGYIDNLCGKLDEARKHYEQAMQIDPNGATAKQARKYLSEL